MDPSCCTALNDFLRNTMENNYMKKYPDFLLNNLSSLLTEIMIKFPNTSELPDKFKVSAFRFIRNPIEYAELSKGHSFDVLFKCYTRLVDYEACLEIMEDVQCKYLYMDRMFSSCVND